MSYSATPAEQILFTKICLYIFENAQANEFESLKSGASLKVNTVQIYRLMWWWCSLSCPKFSLDSSCGVNLRLRPFKESRTELVNPRQDLEPSSGKYDRSRPKIFRGGLEITPAFCELFGKTNNPFPRFNKFWMIAPNYCYLETGTV